MTQDRGSTETPEERAARIQAAKERALAARQARESGAAPPAAAASTVPATETAAPASETVVAAAPAPVEDDRPRTASGTLKRDPDEPKKEPPATPEERAARVAAAKEAAAAAARARAAGGGATAGARPGATAQPSPDEAAQEGVEAAFAAADAGDGRDRTAKGTLKRDPNEPKKEPPKTPEERAARIAAAKAAAAAAKERAAAAPAAGPAPAVAAVARPAARAGAEDAAFRKAFEAVTRPLGDAAHQPLKPVPAARAERPGAQVEMEMTEAQRATVAAFREALDGVQFEAAPTHTDALLVIDPADVLAVMRAAKEHPALSMKFLRCITGVDQMPEGIEVVYSLKSLTTKHAVSIKTLLPARNLVVDSVTSVWLGANWHERELMEMFGVVCAGHPDPRNLLLDEDMTIHPLLKAHPLQDVELKQGVNVF